MSQINDALKRAKKSQKSQPPNLAPGAAPLPPVESESSAGSWSWLLLVILLVAIGCVFIGFAIANHNPPQPQPPAPAQAVVVPVVPKPVPAPPPQTNVVVTPPKPVPPALTLQGIFMGSGKPQAIVNGQTVYVGDTVNGFHVQTISQGRVLFLAPDGTQKMLALGK